MPGSLKNTLCSLAALLSERPQCLVHPCLLPPLLLLSSPLFNIISILPCFVFLHLFATPSAPLFYSHLSPPLLLCIVTPISFYFACFVVFIAPFLLVSSSVTPYSHMSASLSLFPFLPSSLFVFHFISFFPTTHTFSSPLISYPPCSYFTLQVLAKYLQKTKDTARHMLAR